MVRGTAPGYWFLEARAFFRVLRDACTGSIGLAVGLQGCRLVSFLAHWGRAWPLLIRKANIRKKYYVQNRYIFFAVSCVVRTCSYYTRGPPQSSPGPPQSSPSPPQASPGPPQSSIYPLLPPTPPRPPIHHSSPREPRPHASPGPSQSSPSPPQPSPSPPQSSPRPPLPHPPTPTPHPSPTTNFRRRES